MASSVFTGPGGDVRFIPKRVITGDRLTRILDVVDEDVINRAVTERDKLIDELLDIDDKFDLVERAIDEQTKDMRIPAPELSEAIRALGGEGDVIDKDVYDKADKILDSAPLTHLGYDPTWPIFGDPMIQMDGEILNKCSDITKDFPNAKIFVKGRAEAVETALRETRKRQVASTMEHFKNAQEAKEINLFKILWWENLWGAQKDDRSVKGFLLPLVIFPLVVVLTILGKLGRIKFVGKFFKKIGNPIDGIAKKVVCAEYGSRKEEAKRKVYLSYLNRSRKAVGCPCTDADFTFADFDEEGDQSGGDESVNAEDTVRADDSTPKLEKPLAQGSMPIECYKHAQEIMNKVIEIAKKVAPIDYGDFTEEELKNIIY